MVLTKKKKNFFWGQATVVQRKSVLENMIGICGQARMGKDTIADYICDHNKLWKKKAFGHELKKTISHHFGISQEDIEKYKTLSDNVPTLSMNMRQILQHVGESMRAVQPDVWINLAIKKENGSIVFSDVRYENEMNEIIKNDGILILVGRTIAFKNETHPSEIVFINALEWFLQHTDNTCVNVSQLENVPIEFQKFSYFLRNDGTIRALQNAIAETILPLLHKYEK